MGKDKVARSKGWWWWWWWIDVGIRVIALVLVAVSVTRVNWMLVSTMRKRGVGVGERGKETKGGGDRRGGWPL